MSTSEHIQASTPENKESGIARVYTLGFTPETKRKLQQQGAFKGLSPFELLSTLTEEEIAVVLAKVSRNPGGFVEIAANVTEDGAAQFLQKWVASVEGYGHASVAEHAIIHLAVENVSSLAADELTGNRLSSWTEFSARFKGHQSVGYYTPDSVKTHPELEERWKSVHEKLFKVNNELTQKALAYIQSDEGRKKHPERKADGSKGVKTVSDQLKNLMPGSRLTSLGGTLNAREAEHAIRKALSSSNPEVRAVGAMMKEQCLKVAPTLIKYADKNSYLILTREGIEFLARTEVEPSAIEVRPVTLIDFDEKAEEKFIAAALYQKTKGSSFQEILKQVEGMAPDQKKENFEVLLGNLGKHDAPIRMLEASGDYLLEVPKMTYDDLREWRRHRMELYGPKDPNVNYGYMIPPLAQEMDKSINPEFHGSVDAITEVMAEVEELFHAVNEVDPEEAKYLVTRLHYNPTIIKMNLREAYHFVALRTGPTAHPFIRDLAWAFFDEIQKVHPLFASYLEKRLKEDGRPDRNFKWTY
jgi:thymidylate synthase ThyX